MKKILTIMTTLSLILGLSSFAFSQTCPDGNPSGGDNAVKFNPSGDMRLIWPTGSGGGTAMKNALPTGTNLAIDFNGTFFPIGGGGGTAMNVSLNGNQTRKIAPAGDKMKEEASTTDTQQSGEGKFTGTVTFTLAVGGTLSCVYDLGTLPIELIRFNATKKGKEIMISWETATELNNDYIAVERSNDGKEFREIGRLLGAGTSYSTQAYHLADKAPLDGMNYYRLRQVDFDGTVTLSKVVSIAFKQTDKGELLAYPTVLQNNEMLTIDLNIGQNDMIQLEVFNTNGQLINTYDVTAKGKSSLLISSLARGMYIIKTSGLDNDLTTLFFVE